MDEAFTRLDWEPKERAERLHYLFSGLLAQDLALLIVKTKRTLLFESLRFRNLLMIARRGFCVYQVSNESHIPKAISLLIKTKLWHQPNFHMLVIRSDFTEDVSKLLELNPWLTLRKIEEEIPDQAIGYIQPLDGILECYGTDLFRQAIESTP